MAHEVEFHTGIDDPVAFACRLLRKAVRAGARVVCTAPPGRLEELDRALWTFDERDFVPHVRLPETAPPVARRTAIWLARDVDALAARPTAGEARVLVNLDAEAPSNPSAFPRVIELVASDADATARGRERWRIYKAAGLEIRHHLAARAPR
jgi:DNA polymerase-3 subunit chi